jgi:hypothetical protein
MNPRYVQNYRVNGQSPNRSRGYQEQNRFMAQKLLKPKHVTLLEKSLKVNEMQEKKIEEQQTILKDVTERYLALDIKYTEECYERKLLEEENAKLKAQILKLGGKIGNDIAQDVTEDKKITSTNEDTNTTNNNTVEIPEKAKIVDDNKKSGETFVETFNDRLLIQLENEGGIVSDLDSKGAAAKQGILKGDKIISINGVPLRLIYGHTKKPNSREISAFINQSRKSEGHVRICFQRP